MKNITKSKQQILESVSKMVTDKNAVQLFLKGKTSVETLKQKGITLATPL
ncbi:hypothetical protein [Flavobacterium sp. FlaQc-47]